MGSNILDQSSDVYQMGLGGAVTGGTNLGAGQPIFAGKVGVNLTFKTLIAGTAISFSATANELTINSTGEANTAANLGTGTGVFANKTGVTLNFKSLTASDGLTISNTANEINISGSGILDGLAKFTFSTSTVDSPPGAGFFRANNATMSSATFLYVAYSDAYGADISTTLKNLVSGSQLYIKGLNSLTKFLVYTVTGLVTDAAGYVKIPVSYIDQGGTAFVNNDTIEWNFYGSLPTSIVNSGGVVKLETCDLGIIDQEHAISTDLHGMVLTTGAGSFKASGVAIFGRQAVAGNCAFDVGIYDWSYSATINRLVNVTVNANLTVNDQGEASSNFASPYILSANTKYFIVATANNANFALYSKSGALASATSCTFLKAGHGSSLPATLTFAQRNNSGRCIYARLF